jgi:hypothetical protein
MFGDTGFEYMVVVDNPGGSAHQYVVRRARLATKKEFGLYQCEGGKLIHMDGTMEVLGDQL